MKTIYSLILLFVLTTCSYNKYSEGVMNDTKEIFGKHKSYIYELSYRGRIIDKKVCEECKINKYTLTLELSQINEKPEFSNKQYPPYYTFINDSTINLSVNKTLFEVAKPLDIVVKESNTFNLRINQVDYQYLSKEETKWLP